MLLSIVLTAFLVASPGQAMEGNVREELEKAAVFPPPIPVRAPGSPLPAGHKMPLGTQRASEGHVKEYAEALHPQEFFDNHVKPNVPLVFRGLKLDEPAYSLWTDDYLREKYGDQHVRIEFKRENRSISAWRLVMNDFLDRYRKENMYAVTVLPEAMRHEVKVPRSVLCGTFRKYLQELNLWIGFNGTRSVVHYDADHNIHCLLSGRKDFIMIERRFQLKIGLGRKPNNVGSGFSRLEPDSVDLVKYPGVVDTPWTHASLYPGDCIFIPGGYIHQVRGFGRTISETLLFTPFESYEEFNASDCTEDKMKYTRLSDVEIYWTYEGGDSDIEMGYMNPFHVRDLLNSELKTLPKGMTKKKFIAYFLQQTAGNGQGDPAEVFDKWLDLKKTGRVTKEDVAELPLKSLKEIARSMDQSAVGRIVRDNPQSKEQA